MKKHKLIYGLIGTILPIAAFSLAICNNSTLEKEEKNFHGAKAIPAVNRYTTDDLLKETESSNTYKFNFAHMGLGGTSIKTSTVWENYRGEKENNEKVTVAVIDSGLDIYHEDFLKPTAKGVKLTSSNIDQYSIIDPNSCYVHDPSLGNEAGLYTKNVVTDVGIKYAYDDEIYDDYYDEYYSHGTASAACIGAAVNGVGGFGIAPNVNLLIIKIDFYFNSLDVAIRYAADHGADVINMSLGAYSESFTDGYGDKQEGDAGVATYLEDAITYANNKDVVVVAAAGNEKTSHKSYPACNTGVVGVGALERQSGCKNADFSNFNLKNDTSSSKNNVDVMAPGYVWTANVPQVPARSDTTSKISDSFYSETQGTSFASPLTAGAIALYRAKNPTATRQDTINALKASCKDLGAEGWDTKYGFGAVNVEEFLTDSIKVSEVQVTPNKVNLKRNNDNPFPTAQLSASFLPLDATEGYKRGLWLSEDEDIAIVDENTGLVTAKGEGVTRIVYLTDMDMIEGSCEVTVTGKVDLVISEETLTISPTNHNLTSNYGWKNWTVGDIKGQSYVYGNTKDKLQFNSNKTAYYVFNETAIPGEITYITLKGTEKNWKVLTNSTAYKAAPGVPSQGNNAGVKLINSTGVKFPIATKDNYFAICYEDSGAGYINSIEIGYNKASIPAKTVSLNKNELFLKVGESETLIATSNGSVTWSNSNPNVATCENGVITALKEGQTTITATNGSATAQCVVAVTPNYDLENIVLSGEIPAKVPYKGVLDTSKIIVTASYTNGQPSSVVSAVFTELDTNTIGKKTVTASYEENGISKVASFDVFVTNENAPRHEGSSQGEINKTITNKDNVFKTDNGSISGENNTIWNLKVTKNGNASTYYGWDGNNKGSQIGSGSSNVPTAIKITSDSFKDKLVEKVEIKAKSENAKLGISVNGVSFTSNNETQVNVAKTVKTFAFTGLQKGSISIDFTSVSKFSVICEIIVTVKGGTIYSWSGDEQATSYVNYLKGFRTCASDWENRDDIVSLVNEYNFMVQDAKDSNVLNKAFMDHGYNVTPMQKLIKIVDEYNRSLKQGETELKLVLKSNANGEPLQVYETPSNKLIFGINSIDIIAISVSLGLISLGIASSVIVIRKREK